MSKDYISVRPDAFELARRIEDYYHDQGHTHVRCWVERIPNQATSLWQVRSNIRFRPLGA